MAEQCLCGSLSLLCQQGFPSGEGNCSLAVGSLCWLGNDDEATSVHALQALPQLNYALGLGCPGFVSMHRDVEPAFGSWAYPVA